MDAYFGFLTLYVWVFYKELRRLPRIAWFVAIMLLGNMAMSTYVLLQLMRLRPDQDASAVLKTRSRQSPIAINSGDANQQHYELPALSLSSCSIGISGIQFAHAETLMQRISSWLKGTPSLLHV